MFSCGSKCYVDWWLKFVALSLVWLPQVKIWLKSSEVFIAKTVIVSSIHCAELILNHNAALTSSLATPNQTRHDDLLSNRCNSRFMSFLLFRPRPYTPMNVICRQLALHVYA